MDDTDRSDSRNEPLITLKDIRSFHVGGTRQQLTGFKVEALVRVAGDAPVVMDMNGDHMIGQMYATHYQQAAPGFNLPVLLWHGGGMTGACWEDTPDGGKGWLDAFLRARFDVIVSDAFERGRASWPPYPQFLDSPPEHRSLDVVWHHFRFGAPGSYPTPFDAAQARERAYPGLQFPVEHLEQFGRQFVPRWTGTESLALDAYGALLERVGPCVVIGHSQGASYALECARRFPDLVKGVVAVEPPALPMHDAASAPRAPHLFVWGDFIRGMSESWSHYFGQAEAYRQWLGETGARADLLELPAEGIAGNSHMLITERNNRAIAARVQAWIGEHVDA